MENAKWKNMKRIIEKKIEIMASFKCKLCYIDISDNHRKDVCEEQ
jgi:hypothetical protein